MKQVNKRFYLLWIALCLVLLAAELLAPGGGEAEAIQVTMRDAVLHEGDRITLFGLRSVNPGLISSLVVTVVLLAAAALLRIFVIPKFQYVPGRVQLLLEEAVSLFDGLAKSNRPWRNGFLGRICLPPGPTFSLARCLSCLAFRRFPRRGIPSPSLRPCPTSMEPLCWGYCPTWSLSRARLPETACGALEAP